MMLSDRSPLLHESHCPMARAQQSRNQALSKMDAYIMANEWEDDPLIGQARALIMRKLTAHRFYKLDSGRSVKVLKMQSPIKPLTGLPGAINELATAMGLTARQHFSTGCFGIGRTRLLISRPA